MSSPWKPNPSEGLISPGEFWSPSQPFTSLFQPIARPWSPAVNISETDSEVVLLAELPGVDQRNLEIQLENGVLTIKGERKLQGEGVGRFHRIEWGYGSFTRAFQLPETVESQKIKAEYKNGVLRITLPKTKTFQVVTVPINMATKEPEPVRAKFVFDAVPPEKVQAFVSKLTKEVTRKGGQLRPYYRETAIVQPSDAGTARKSAL